MDVGDWIAVSSVVVAVNAILISLTGSRHADASAKAANASATEARRVAEIETARQHEHHEPELPHRIEAEREVIRGHAALFGSITVRRPYRVRAHGCIGSTRTQLGALPVDLEPNQVYRFRIEDMAPGQTTAQTEEIRFKFWPPVSTAEQRDPAWSAWSCPCDRPSGEDPDGPAHWELRIPVSYHDVTNGVR